MADDDSVNFDDELYDEVDDEEDDDELEEEKEEDLDEDEDLGIEKEQYAKQIAVMIIPKEKRRTSNRISLFEFVNAIGTRAEAIANGDEIYIPIENKETSLEIAEAEIRAGKCPFIIERPIYKDNKNGTIWVEHWSLRELILPTITQ